MNKKLVLIVCTGNFCRSQIAEAILRPALGPQFTVASAGVEPMGRVHPLVSEIMSEIGIDTANHRSKHINEFVNRKVDTVLTLCDFAAQKCPIFPGQLNRHHWSFEDPAMARDKEKHVVFRRVRDEMRRVLEAYAAGRRDALTTPPATYKVAPARAGKPGRLKLFFRL